MVLVENVAQGVCVQPALGGGGGGSVARRKIVAALVTVVRAVIFVSIYSYI